LSFHELVECDAGAAPIPMAAGDQLSQLLARIEHPCFHRGHRNAKDFANLFCRPETGLVWTHAIVMAIR